MVKRRVAFASHRQGREGRSPRFVCFWCQGIRAPSIVSNGEGGDVIYPPTCVPRSLSGRRPPPPFFVNVRSDTESRWPPGPGDGRPQGNQRSEERGRRCGERPTSPWRPPVVPESSISEQDLTVLQEINRVLAADYSAQGPRRRGRVGRRVPSPRGHLPSLFEKKLRFACDPRSDAAGWWSQDKEGMMNNMRILQKKTRAPERQENEGPPGQNSKS